ncbi:(2Fe-2S)-binding protein [Caloranaerobacter ferrireducens]|uniref:(2Fe-2S)-binding protein n=1 Tax=Caloranaerobacter ferrireducens TaxID=1323370 RepID=UPI00084D4A62|nr:(2Fe-2S)-binding protein [Caloranaerobacter ferrireducens]
MIEKTGIPTLEMIKRVFPSIERINRGPVAVIECFQRIPCNPCATVCKQNAIKNFDDINDIPIIDTELCNGCGLCISSCPGLAIMVVDGSWSEDKVLFKIPYEFLPLPKEGDIVKGLDRKGDYITDVKIIKVQNSKTLDKTPILHIEVKKDFLYEFRNIKLNDYDEYDDYMGDKTIVCRCSDVTLGQIRKLIKEGYTNIEEIKRITRAGMGPCQGRTCSQIILREISMAIGIDISKLKPCTSRPPIKPIKINTIVKGAEMDD